MQAAMMSSVQSPWHERCNVGIFVYVINIAFVMFLVRFYLNKLFVIVIVIVIVIMRKPIQCCEDHF